MRTIVITYKSLNHKNPTPKQYHHLEMSIPDNMGEITSIEIMSEPQKRKVLKKVL